MENLTVINKKKQNEMLQLVTFTLEGEEFAVDILKVQEINRMKEITRIPNSPDYIEGVINLRGKVIPVINLRKRFNLPVKEYNEQSRIMIMEVCSIIMGLIVDSVSEVLRIPGDLVKSAPSIATTVSSEFIKGIAEVDSRLIILLEMDKLLAENEQKALTEVS